MSSAPPKPVPGGVWEAANEFKDAFIVPPTIEFIRLLPDGIVLGVAILSILSFCKSYCFILFSMFELMFIQRAISSVIGSISPVGSGPNAANPICQNGLMFPNKMRISLIETIGTPSMFPSPTLFFTSGILTYMVGCVQEFKNEILTLGGDLGTRTTVAAVLSSMFLFVLFAFRYNYGCEAFGTLILSGLFGAIVGYLLIYQNKALFGRDSVNILNLPMIVSATEMGKPMYVCAAPK